MEGAIGILIGSNVIALLILIIRRCLRKYLSKRFVYGMWILIPLFMLIFPFVKVPAPEFVQNAPVTVRDWADAAVGERQEASELMYENLQEKAEAETDTVEPSPMLQTEGTVVAGSSIPNRVIPWEDILVRAYVTIAALGVGVIIYINVSFILRCKKIRTWREKSFGLGLAVYELPDISSPFLFGRSIYIPTSMSEEEMRYGTLHEEYHYRHGDSMWVIVRYLILAIHFYSPIMWMAFKASGYDCELACDEAVMERIEEGERRNYGRCLLQIMENSKYRTAGLLSTNMKSGKSLIKERIKVIASEASSSLCVMLVVVAFMLVVVSWMLLEKTEKLVEHIEAANMSQTTIGQTEAGQQEELSGDTEANDDVEDAQPCILRPCRLGQYYSIITESPWIVEDENGVLFGYMDDVHVDGGPLPKELGPRFFLDAEASSVLETWKDEIYYDADYAAYSDRENTWAEGVIGDGIGEYVEIQQLQEAYEHNTIDGKLYFDEMCIVTGYAKNEKVWQNNNRVKTLNFYFEGEFVGVIELEDTMLPQYIDISALDLHVLNGEMANFRFEIVEVYDGNEEATCITGVDFKFRSSR
ncbi:MAG: hypothetical protein IJX63_07690 [Lachnospiraceae bacterium]|nr:hypothetical protein [Lachnospiraceae bacterium]